VIASVGQVVLQKFIENDPDCQPCVVGVQPLPEFDRSASHRLVVEGVDTQFHVFLDEALVMETEDSQESAITEAGNFRFGAYLRGTHVIYDDLVLSPITQFTDENATADLSALPDVAATALNLTEAPLVFERDDIAVSIGSDTTSPASLTELPLDQPLQNFVVSATLSFDTGAVDDQCGLVYRADLENSSFHWIDLTASNFLMFGTAQTNPSNPEFSGRLAADGLDSLQLLVIANDGSAEIALNGVMVQLDIPIIDDNPVAGDLYLWVYLSALHESTCHFENVQVWSLD
jgi:hypothetical protein